MDITATKVAGYEKNNIDDDIPAVINSMLSPKKFRKNCVRLIQKIYEVDPLVCPKCQGEMRIIAFIEFPHIIKRILEHLGLWLTHNHDPPPPRTESSTCVTYDDAYSQFPPYDYWIQ